jgi:DNA polymerase III alpha subunit
MYNNTMDKTLANEDTGLELLYRQTDLLRVPFTCDVVKQFNKFADELELEHLVSQVEYSKDFNIPQHYKEIDVEEYIRGLIPTSGDSAEAVEARVEMELAEYKARNLFPVLQLLIYIIDTMRKNNLVWGVGRGSSVSSYLLYLIGVHKVDSVKYNLNIKEFLK